MTSGAASPEAFDKRLRLEIYRQFMSLARIIELLSTNPARIFSALGRGTLAVGSHADVTIFDPKKKWTFEASKSRSKSKNTPFDGRQMVGKVVMTVVGGRNVYQA